jgi:hypothetical protein
MDASLVPYNSFPNGSVERNIFGKIMAICYYSNKQFWNNNKDDEGYVTLERIMNTATFRHIIKKNPQVTIEFIKDILEGAMSVKVNKIRPIPHTHSSILHMIS